MEEFSIELGAKLKLNNLQEQINKASSNLKPLEITINTEKSEKKITALTEQISKLNNEFKIMENMGSLSSNLDVINKSLKSIAIVIDKINKADGFNNLGKGLSNFAPVAEMIKNELSAIKTAMESFKGFNINFDVKSTIGKGALSEVKESVVFELRQQVEAIENLYMRYTKAENGVAAVTTAFRGTQFADSNKILKTSLLAHDSSLKIDDQISALQRYINVLQQGANFKGIDLSPATANFKRTADEIIESVSKIGTGEQNLTNQTNQLKNLFGSGVDAEKLTAQLDAIKVSIDNVSTAISGIKFDDSTLNTFKETISSLNLAINQLSTSITKLDGKPIAPKIASTDITQTTREIQKAEVETQKLKQTTEQIKPVGNALINSEIIKEFETKVQQVIYDEKELEKITRETFEQFGSVTTNTTKTVSHEIDTFAVKIKNLKTNISETLRFRLNPDSGYYKYQGSSGSDNYARQQEVINKQIEKNNAAVTNYTATLNKLEKEYRDVNATKPIQDTSHLETLNGLLDIAKEKVNALKTSTKEHYATTEASAKSAITALETQIRLYRQEEYAANQLRAKPIETIKSEQVELLRKFRAEIEASGIAFNKFKTFNIGQLSGKVNGITDKQSLMDYLNSLSVAQAEFKALQAEQKVEQEKVNSAYRETLSLIQQIRNIQTNLLNLDKEKDKNQILELEGQLKRLQESYQAIRRAFNSKFSLEQTTEINSALQTTIDKMATVQAKIDDVKASSFHSIKDNISNGTLENQIQTIENDYRRLGLTEDEIAQKTQMLKSLLSTMDASDTIESVTRDYTTFGQEVVKTRNDVKALRREQQKAKDEANFANGKNVLNSQIDVWLKKNSAAASEFGTRLRRIQQELLTADSTKLTELKREFQEIKRQADLAGKSMLSFGDKLKSKLGSLATYFSATMMISYAIRGIRSMFQNVLQVDTAMTELYRVTDLTGKQYSQLYDNMIDSAKKYGVALNEIIESTASWVRLGFDANKANKLAEITTMYQHVTDLDNDTAVKNLVTAYKGYQDELLQISDGDSTKAIMRVADIYDKLGEILPVKNYIG